MRSLLIRLLAGTIPVIAMLVAAAFVLPAGFPWLPRQLLLGVIGIGGIALAEVVLFHTQLTDLPRRLGFIVPRTRFIIICVAASAPMWLFLPLASYLTGTPLLVAPNWPSIIFGVILVNGLAEESIHRTFFFGRLRERTTFLAAASLGAALFGARRPTKLPHPQNTIRSSPPSPSASSAHPEWASQSPPPP